MMKGRKPEEKESEDAIMERMDKALKKMMSTPHETQKEMIARRRQGSPPAVAKQRKVDIDRRKQLVDAGKTPKRG